jgi:flagellar basal body-associated protein FliL
MSRASRQRQREAKQRQPKRKFRWIILIVAIGFIACGVFAWVRFHPKQREIIATATHDPSQPRTLKELLALSPANLDKVDIGFAESIRSGIARAGGINAAAVE